MPKLDGFGGTVSALRGVKVVGMTHIGAGPYALSLLGDLGAEVVNIESLSGDSMRTRDNYGPGSSAYFFGLNRNKRSISVDAKAAEGREIVLRLVGQADVFVHNMRPGAMPRLGLSYADLEAINPALLYCTISPFGPLGPEAMTPAMDLIAQARGGLMGLNGFPGMPPARIPPPIADFTASFLACFGISAALYAREQDGRGQEIDVSLLAGQVASLANLLPYFHFTGRPNEPVGGAHPQLVPYGPQLTADGYIIVACLTERMWVDLCGAIDREDLVGDHRYKTNIDRVQNRKELADELDRTFGEREAGYWLERLAAHGVPADRIQTLEGLLHDPQVAANGYIRRLHTAEGDDIPIAGPPVVFSRTPAEIHSYANSVGQHTTEVLVELGYSADDIEGFIAAEIVRQAGPPSSAPDGA